MINVTYRIKARRVAGVLEDGALPRLNLRLAGAAAACSGAQPGQRLLPAVRPRFGEMLHLALGVLEALLLEPCDFRFLAVAKALVRKPKLPIARLQAADKDGLFLICPLGTRLKVDEGVVTKGRGQLVQFFSLLFW